MYSDPSNSTGVSKTRSSKMSLSNLLSSDDRFDSRKLLDIPQASRASGMVKIQTVRPPSANSFVVSQSWGCPQVILREPPRGNIFTRSQISHDEQCNIGYLRCYDAQATEQRRENIFPPDSIIPAHEPKTKRPWTQEEDDLLRALTEHHGVGLWATIAQHIPTRTGKQVRERWLNHLSPGVVKRPWSEEEDRVIIETHLRYGNAWSRIAKMLHGRSDNSVKNRFYTSLRRRIHQLGMLSGYPRNSLGMPYCSYTTSKRRRDGSIEEEAQAKRPRMWQ